jgi:hypothetical protein
MRPPAWQVLLAEEDPQSLFPLLAKGLGFGLPSPADAVTQRGLGVPEEITPVFVAAGQGTCRLLLVGIEEGATREKVSRLADHLSRKAPHLLWLVAALNVARRELAVAAWQPRGPSTRTAAVVIDCTRVLPSDCETLSELADTIGERLTDIERHARWVEVLGREAISRRFFHVLQSCVARLAEGAAGSAGAAARHEIALLNVSRLLFLAFLEARGWLDNDRRFLTRTFDDCMASGGRYQKRVLDPLFFGTLNTPVSARAPLARSLGRLPFLNGGLFTRAAVERRGRAIVLRDEDLGGMFDELFVRYRFTPREETSTWQESAIDPEILGRAFESLMVATERRVTGAFYTPLALVSRATDAALEVILESRGVSQDTCTRALGGVSLGNTEAEALRRALTGLRVLDPACGSGAFLVHVLDQLTRLRVASGDARSPGAIRRDVVAQSIFGVDVNHTAVWLCELRLWLSLVIDHPAHDPASVPPLPNLDHNIRCGDTLAGGDFSLRRHDGRVLQAALLRSRYARATGTRKRTLAGALDRVERANLLAWLDSRLDQVAAQRRSLVTAARGRDLFGRRRGVVSAERDEARHLRDSSRSLRHQRRSVAQGGALPFGFVAQFPDAARAGGFDVVVGNPPWIRLHNLPPDRRETLRREFKVYRDAVWLSGARAARAGSGFGSQVDAASLFVERSHQLIREDGVLSLLVPFKLWRSLAGGGVRRLMADRANVRVVEDWSGAPAQFDAATYPSLVVAQKRAPDVKRDVTLAVHRASLQVTWTAPRSTLALDDSSGAAWLLLPPAARDAFDRLTRAGVPLANAGLGTATLGVKCGCNDAFLVRALSSNGRVEVSDGNRSSLLDSTVVRPVLRGEGVRPWRQERGNECIVFPYSMNGRLLSSLSGPLRSWLQPWRGRLESRTDLRGNRAWWSLFRLEGAKSDRPRVVWSDLGRSLQALVLDAGDRTVPLNTCYVLPTRDLTDALALAAFLNSPVIDAWVGAVAEPARGNYRRHFAWTMARLPVPDDWARAREILAPLGEAGVCGKPPSRAELMQSVLDAFRVRSRTIAPLVEWING